MIKFAVSGILLSIILAGPVNAGENSVTIRFSTQSRPNTPAIQSVVHFKEHVEEASRGAIRVEVHHSAELYTDDQVGKAVSSGAVEMGVINLSRYAETIPIADAFQQPFLFNTEDLERKATAPGSQIRGLIDEAILTRAGARVLWWLSQGQTVFLSNGESVSDPEKLTNRTVRTFGPTIEAVVTECGGHPRDIGGSEQEAAYKKHEVDIGMAGISTVVGRKLWHDMSIITRTNHASVQFVVAINEKFWQGLSKDSQEIILKAAAAADEETRAIISDIEAKSYQELEAKNVKVVSLTDEELQLWRICSTDVLLQWLQKAGEAGHELMVAYGRMRKQACCGEGMPRDPIRPAVSGMAAMPESREERQ